MDPLNWQGELKHKLTIYFQQKRKRRLKEFVIRIRLKDYSQIDNFMEQLTKYDNLNIKVYNIDVNPNPFEEM